MCVREFLYSEEGEKLNLVKLRLIFFFCLDGCATLRNTILTSHLLRENITSVNYIILKKTTQNLSLLSDFRPTNLYIVGYLFFAPLFRAVSVLVVENKIASLSPISL